MGEKLPANMTIRCTVVGSYRGLGCPGTVMTEAYVMSRVRTCVYVEGGGMGGSLRENRADCANVGTQGAATKEQNKLEVWDK